MIFLFLSFAISSYYRPLTYYSMIKLEHNQTKRYLSASQLSFEGGSHQMLTRASSKDYLAESLWTILPQNFSSPNPEINKLDDEYINNNHINQGDVVQCNDIVQLYHTTSRGFLHSHNFFSFLGRGYEMTSFPEVDKGNWWYVKCDDEDEVPIYGHLIRLQHASLKCSAATDTKSQLPPQNGGQFELYCSLNSRGAELLWKATEGIFVDKQYNEDEDEDEDEDEENNHKQEL